MNPENTLVRKQVLEGYSFPAKVLAYLVLCEHERNKRRNPAECPNKSFVTREQKQQYSTEEIIKARLSCLKYLR
jgi:hypothetical protein